MPRNRPANQPYNKPLTTAAERAAARKALRLRAEREALDATILPIAKKHLRLETLESRDSDRLDFSDQHVSSIRAALEAAYAAGKAAR